MQINRPRRIRRQKGDEVDMMPAEPIDDPDDTAAAEANPESRRADLTVRRALVADQPRFLAFLIRRLRDRDTAGEVFQRFVLHALERSDDIRDPGAVHGWLGRVLASTLADHYRRAHRMQRNERAMREADLARLITNLERDDTAAACVCLHLLLPGLRPAYAELLRRVDLEGEPHAQAAAQLRIDINNLYVRLHRARQDLRRRLMAFCRTCPEDGFLACRCEGRSPL